MHSSDKPLFALLQTLRLRQTLRPTKKGDKLHRGCQSSYFPLLSKTQKMVYNIHQKADKVSGAVKPNGRGKHCNRHRVSFEDKEKVLAHIKPFTLVDSHYCKQKNKNKKKILIEWDFFLEKLHDLCKGNSIENKRPFIKSSYYRFIFNTCFNIGFHVPKTDRCKRCEEMKI